MEAGHHLEWLLGVDLELVACTIEVEFAHAVGVDVAAITVSWCDEAITVLRTALRILHAHMEARVGGWVWGVSSGNLVWDPALVVSLAVHPLEVTGALSITVAGSVSCASKVGWASVSSLLHLGEVDGRVGATWHVAHINIERDLLLEHVEQLVLMVILHHI